MQNKKETKTNINRLFNSTEDIVQLSDDYTIGTSEARCKAIEETQGIGNANY